MNQNQIQTLLSPHEMGEGGMGELPNPRPHTHSRA
jgi:hypothetical protein